MAILKYVPPVKKIIDNRKPEGGYYEAECEICGTIFYPERSNAKYCTPNCGLIAHRKAKADILASGGKIETKNKDKEIKTLINAEFRGAKQVYQYLKENFNTHGQRNDIMDMLKITEVGSSFEYENVIFRRISPGKWTA